MKPTATLIDNLKELLAAANPGLATKEDIARLEQRVDELTELVHALATKLGHPAGEAERRGPMGPDRG